MGTQGDNDSPVQVTGDVGERYSVDASGAKAVLVGDHSTQINYSYHQMTWTDGVAPTPIVSVSGQIDSPYRGLSAFEERDAAFFHGRTAAATQVLDRMSRSLAGGGILVVSGASGAGKSSLLRAGVLPRVRGTGLSGAPGSASWPCLVFTPTREPLEELALRVSLVSGADAGAIRRGLSADPDGFALTARQAAYATHSQGMGSRDAEDRRLLLVIDQFEQLFTQCADEAQRRAFVAALRAAAGGGHNPGALVVIGVRADFEARCASYPELTDAVQDRYLVTPMTERQLRMAITEPAKQAGAQVDEDLVAVLAGQVRSRQAGASGTGLLPLLSHALDQAWRSRGGPNLTLADYERTGGVEGAVADSAERAYAKLSPGQQELARQVFIRLTATTSDGVDTADRVARADLTAGRTPQEAQDVTAVLEAFTAQRLLTIAADTVEISHEVLLSAWPLLRDSWLAETHADRIVRTRLRAAAAAWEGSSRDQSYLYAGSLLHASTEAAARIAADPARNPPLSAAESDFLRAGLRAQQRRARARQAFLALLAAVAIGLAAVTVVVIRADRQATQQRDIAAQQRNIASSGQLASESEVVGENDPVLARLLSAAAARLDPSPAARYALASAAALPGLQVLTYGAPVAAVAFSPHGSTVAAVGGPPVADAYAQLWDVPEGDVAGVFATGNFPGTIKMTSSPQTSVAYSPDGALLATGDRAGLVELWNVATHQPVGAPMAAGDGAVTSVAFSPDGALLAVGDSDGTTRLWSVGTDRPAGARLAGQVGAVTSVAFSPGGKTLAIGGTAGAVSLWNVASQRLAGLPLAAHGRAVTSVAFSPDGTTLAAGDGDGTAQLWDVATRQRAGVLAGHAGTVDAVAFSPDGKTLATADGNGTAQLWDVAAREPVGSPLTGHSAAVTSVAFSPDGATLATGSDDGTVRLWDAAAGRLAGGTLTVGAGAVDAVAFSPGRKLMATGGADGAARLWDVATHHLLGSPLAGCSGRVASLAFSPDGATLAAGCGDGTVLLWSVASGHLASVPLRGLAAPATSVAFSRDGRFVAAGAETVPAGSPAGAVHIWNTATLRSASVPVSALGGASIAFTPDGKYLAAAITDGTVELFSLAAATSESPAISEQYGFQTDSAIALAFSPDGATMATVSADGRIQLWQTPTAALPNGKQLGQPLDSDAGSVTSIAFSPDGETLAAGTTAGSVVRWDVATKQLIGSPLSGQRGPVTSVDFSPSGALLASGGGDGTARLWNVGYASASAARVCAAAGRALTSVEWQQYGPASLGYQPACPTPGSVPGTGSLTLGRSFGLFRHGDGFGQVRPAEIFNGGDPTGLVTHIAWTSWGTPEAIGTGTAYYEGPGKAVAQSTAATATVVAFDPGPCDGRVMYRAVEWYFPGVGGFFDPSTFEDVCDGTYVGLAN